MSATAVLTFPEWLRLREPADAEARSGELVEELRGTTSRPARSSSTTSAGAAARWVAGWLRGCRSRSTGSCTTATRTCWHSPSPTRRPGVTVEARRGDITRLAPDALAGADVVVASALLDMLTADELTRMLAACAGRPLLIAMTVSGRVSFALPEPLDVPLGVAFNAHQRRDGRLGPDAVPAALDALGGEVLVRPSPWHLGTAHAELMTAWFGGWVDAACEKEPELASEARAYRERRLAGAHEATVEHADLLVLP